MTSALSELAGFDTELVAAEKQWWSSTSDALTPALVAVVGASRAQAVAAAMNEIAAELATAAGEVVGDDLGHELISRGVVTETEYEALDQFNKQQLHDEKLNPLTRVIHATWDLLKAEELAEGEPPAITKFSVRDGQPALFSGVQATTTRSSYLQPVPSPSRSSRCGSTSGSMTVTGRCDALRSPQFSASPARFGKQG